MSNLRQLRTQAITRWQALSAREQRGISILGVMLGIWLFWTVAIHPARHILDGSDQRRTQIDQQHAQMLALQNQAQALKSRPVLSRDDTLRHLQSFTSSPKIQLTVQGDRVLVQLQDVPASTLADWLAKARTKAQALPTEAHLTRQTAAAGNLNSVVWNGTLVLNLPPQGTTP